MDSRNISQLKSSPVLRGIAIRALQVGLILMLVGAGWLIYRRLPATSAEPGTSGASTTLQIVIRQSPESFGSSLDVPVSLYPVDIVAVRHEFFTEQRFGKRFEDFLKERMRGRTPVNARLDKQGNGAVMLAPGSWWLHATLSGEEQLEWRLPVKVGGAKQTIELTPQNAYTRSRTF
ncbi:MAG TPA: hypothetical protein VFB70_19250 [Pyrinomonadaceae bacterium]|nr:hypothetical protein [Pyrinomonadaceae bacterium]